MIVFHHLHHPSLQFDWLPLGLRQSWTGVHIFFVISGFVVGLSLLNQLSYQSTSYFGRVNTNRQIILNFLKRRFYRLAPSAVSVLGFIAIMFIIFDFQEPIGLSLFQRLAEIGRALVEYLVPSYNTHIVFSGFKIPNRLTTAPYWSLAIENQFYLLLPFFMLLWSRKRDLIASSLAVFATVSFLVRPAFKYFYPEDSSDVINVYYANSLTNFDGLFFGVALAGLFSKITPTQPIRPQAWMWILVTFAFAWIYPNLWGSGTDRGRNIMSTYTLTILATGYMVWRCAKEELLNGKLPFKGKALNLVLNYLGSRSYVLYHCCPVKGLV